MKNNQRRSTYHKPTTMVKYIRVVWN